MKKIILTLLLSLISFSGQSYAGFSFPNMFDLSSEGNINWKEQLSVLSNEIDKLEKGSKEQINQLKKFILSLEKSFSKKIDKCKSKLEKYKESLNEANEEDAKKIIKKIKSSEEQIASFQELLAIIEQLKIKITEKEESSSS